MKRAVWRVLRGDLEVLAVPVLEDNFVYLICRGREAVLVDAGEAAPVIQLLTERGLVLREICVTHRHFDHIGGLVELQRVVVPRDAGVEVVAFDTPGHLPEHRCFYLPEAQLVCTGDTLINGACGRLLGGTAEQLFDSLGRIAALPEDTLVLGGHDYLEDNLRFALAEEPENAAIADRLARYKKDPPSALFVTLKEERATNPFLRQPSAAAFAAMRRRKDLF
jgi:hydroxyacylglutathione hydrolase